jgi:hypothetical protein
LFNTKHLEFSEYRGNKWQAKGKLLKGNIPYREDEVMRYDQKYSCAILMKRIEALN